MINEKIEKALNDQIKKELDSSYLYLSMAAYFNSINLSGFENWMKVQAAEELKHAMKIFGYIEERLGRVTLQMIAVPQKEWKSTLDAFSEAYKHEQFITSSINDIVTLARSEKDYATENFLQWFISEQVEEESSAAEIVSKLEMIKDSKNALFMLDSILGKRGKE